MTLIGRPRAFDRHAALEAAMLLFWRKGFSGASMNDLCGAMEIRSPSLYAAFGSKDALYLEAMDHYVRSNGPPVWDKLEEGNTARQGVEKLLLAGTQSLPQSDKTPAGCMALLGGVSDEWPAPIAELTRTVRLEMLDHLRSCFEKAVAAQELSRGTDIERLSRFYLSVFQGMAIQARDGATTKDLEGIAGAAMNAWPTDSGRS